jgi:hypothetical protein
MTGVLIGALAGSLLGVVLVLGWDRLARRRERIRMRRRSKIRSSRSDRVDAPTQLP